LRPFWLYSVNDRNKQGHLRSERLEKTIARCYEFVQLAHEKFWNELHEAFWRSIKAKGIEGSEWIILFICIKGQEGRIVYDSNELLNSINSFEIFKNIEEEIQKTLHSLFGDNHEMTDDFSINREACAFVADDHLSNLSCMGHNYESVDQAWNSLNQAYNSSFSSIAEQTWTPLEHDLERIEIIIRREYDYQTSCIENNAAEFSNAVTSLSRVYEQGRMLFRY